MPGENGRKLVTLEFDLGDRLRKARLHAHLEQEEMAEKLGVTIGTISNWESGRVQPRNLRAVVEEWSELTGVDPIWLLRMG